MWRVHGSQHAICDHMFRPVFDGRINSIIKAETKPSSSLKFFSPETRTSFTKYHLTTSKDLTKTFLLEFQFQPVLRKWIKYLRCASKFE